MDERQEGIDELAGWLAQIGADYWQSSGTDPLHCSELTRRIMRERNVRLGEEVVRRHSAPTSLAHWLFDHADSLYYPLMELARSSVGGADVKRPLIVCVHALSGYARAFRRLAEVFSQFGDVWSIQARGLNPGETPFGSFEAMQHCYRDEIIALANGRPIHMLGFSFGGAAAHAISIDLLSCQQPVGTTFVLDTILFSKNSPVPSFDEFLGMMYRESDSNLSRQDWDAFERSDSDGKLKLFFGKLASTGEAATSLTETDTTGFFAKAMSPAAMKRVGLVSYELHRILRAFEPSYFPGRTVLIRSLDSKRWSHPFVLWKPQSADLIVENIACLHVRMLQKPMALQKIARLFRQYS